MDDTTDRWADALDLEWVARWVAPVEDEHGPDRRRPVHQLAGPVRLDGEVSSATLHVTAHGIYEAFVNGQRVGDAELTPGWTAYRRRLAVQSHDVTDLVVPGDNVLGALLSDGWWRGANSASRRVDDYGTTTALLAQLDVTFADGSVASFGTGDGWCSTPSHILAADLMGGEVHDLRRRVPWEGWAGWEEVRVEDHGTDTLVRATKPPVRRVEEIRPVAVHRLGPERWVVDVGQNINGWVRLQDLGPAGTTTNLTYGEWLGPDGDVTRDNLLLSNSPELADLVFQEDRVTSAGVAGDVFEPRHSTKGFQFVRVEGHPGPLTADDVTAVFVHTDLTPIGGFSCSNPRIDAFHAIADRSFRGNACEIPTDCPTRERAGWTGDWQLFVETAGYLYDVHDFSVAWLRDLAADQRPDGRVTNLVPESHPGDGREPAIWPDLEGSAGWGDAAVHVPWVLHRLGGDTEVLAEQFDSARVWVDWAAGVAAGRRHPARVARSPEPRPHERYVWDTGWHFNEWLEAGASLDDSVDIALGGDHGPVATAYLHRSAAELSEIARRLGRDDEADRYAALAAEAADAWRTEFLADDGRTTPDTQATYVRALAFGLIPDDLRPAAATRLVELIRAAGTHLGTGFLATPYLLPVLADTGHLDVAYELLLQDTEPSWLVMIDRGATTVWEEWGGIDADGRPHASLNHYSKGAVISFLHQYVAGLQLVEAGFRRVRVAPRPGGGLTWARTHHDGPLGRIEVAWSIADGAGTLEVVLPPGTTAELVLPDGRRDEVGGGEHRRTWPVGSPA